MGSVLAYCCCFVCLWLTFVGMMFVGWSLLLLYDCGLCVDLP